MELQKFCIGNECHHSKKCKFSRAIGKAKCPVYHFAEKRRPLIVDEKGFYKGPMITTCPSCGAVRSVLDAMYGDDIWGNICGYCLYEFAMKGYPTNQSIRTLRSRGLDIRKNEFGGFKSWDMEEVDANGKD